MSTTNPGLLLRRVLFADAAVSGATGLLLLLGGGALDGLLGLPAALLRWPGASLLPFAALVAWVATLESPPRAAVWAVIACNALWAADSLILLATGWVAPTGLGHAFVIAQALVVVAFAWLQHLGLRRLAEPAAGAGIRSAA